MAETLVHELLVAVEQLPAEACGAFVVMLDDVGVGSVFVEKNRVCWAAHSELSRRLRTLLREHLAADLRKAEAMRRAIEQHTVESLLALPQDQGEQVLWFTHQNHGYQPRFTFAPSELLVGVNAFLYQSEATGAELAFSTLDQDIPAASFVPADGGGLVPVRLSGPPLPVTALDELGAWADAAFGATRGFSLDVVKRAAEAATGDVCVAWQTSRLHTHAALLPRGPTLERLLDQFEGRRFPAVISRRAFSASQQTP